MKLRSIICLSAVAAASAVFALDSNTVFARLRVDQTGAPTNTVIAIPFAGCGETSAQIYVTNLVMTANLSQGDTLMYNNGTKWFAWQINASHEWEAVSTATKLGGVNITPDASSFAVDCGKACWLIRNSTSAPVYLYGQVNGTEPESVRVSAAANASDYAYTLIARPNEATALDLNTWKGNMGAADGDMILLPAANISGADTYKYNGSAWTAPTVSTTEVTRTNPRTKQQTTVTVTNITWQAISASTPIPAGSGFLYGRKGTTEGIIKWVPTAE